MRELPPGPVFDLADAYAIGWTRSALRHAVHIGRLSNPRRGIYVRPDCPQPAIRAVALNYPGALVSHHSSGLLRGVPILGSVPRLPQLTVAPRSNANLAGVHVYRAATRPEDVAVVDGIAVTSMARTLIDMSRHGSIASGVAAIDHALHHGLVSPAELDDVLRFCRTWPRIRRAHRAVRLSDARSESPFESVSRLALRWMGLPTPDLQRVVLDPAGAEVGRLDFYWDEFGVAGEADGRQKFDPTRARYPVGDPLNEEKDRQELMENLHLVFTRWRWEHTTWRRYDLRSRVLDAFDRGRARDRAGITRLWHIKPLP